MSKFLKIKSHSFLAFIIFVGVMFFSISFGIERNYILYILLIATFLFAVNIIISYIKFKNYKEEIFIWTNDLSSKPPYLIEASKIYDNINEIYEQNNKKENSFEDKMRVFKDYVSMWAHQIKTPLFSLDLILNNHPIDAHGAKAEVFAIEEYVDTLLSYMRLESLSTDFVFEEASLDALINSSIKKYSKIFIRKKNRVDFRKTGLRLTTDKKWFSFILDQILSNSNKYTQDGKISFYMDGKKLIIQDTGIGIREEDLPRVFEKSYTGYNGRIYKKSTGIGLSLVKTTAENLSIDVGINSKLREGTQIILDLKNVLN